MAPKTQPDNALALRDAQSALALNDSQVDVLRATIAPGYSDTELALFLWYCQRSNLDPFIREVWTFRNRDGKIVIGVGIDGFRKRASATGQYAPGGTRYEEDAKGRLVAAHVTVRRWHPETGTWLECDESAYASEFGGRGQHEKMPRVMTAKCAEARALRRLFPAELGGLYVREEIDDARDQRATRSSRIRDAMPPIDATAEVVDAPARGTQDTPRAAVMRQGLALGATQQQVIEIVRAEQGAGNVPEDSDSWTDDHARHLIDMIDLATRQE